MKTGRLAGVWMIVFAASLAGPVGCDKLGLGKSNSKSEKKADDDDDSKKEKKKHKKDDDGEKEASVKGSAPAPSAPPPNAAPTGSAASDPATGPSTDASASPSSPSAPGHSPVPTVAEWEGVTTEVGVLGSSKLNCETKMLREWLRVSCRGKNETGGTPTGVSVTKGGGHGDDFALASGGIASLVVRYVEGIDLDAKFTWTDGSRTLHVVWPRNMPEPKVKGAFDAGATDAAGAGPHGCRTNAECKADEFCMPDGRCHPAAEVQ